MAEVFGLIAGFAVVLIFFFLTRTGKGKPSAADPGSMHRRKVISALPEESRPHFDFIESLFSSVYGRLDSEIARLRIRERLSLVIGASAALIGIGVLGWVIFSPKTDNAPTTGTELLSLIYALAPKLSFAFFVEVFAFYFLRLYKESLSEIKYYQNEITTLQSKHLALLSLAHNDSSLPNILSVIVQTDRNDHPRMLSRKDKPIDIRQLEKLIDMIMQYLRS